MARRKPSAQAPRSTLDIPPSPTGFAQGFLAPWKLGRLLLARPFAWLRPGLACFLVFVSIISLLSEVIANALFPGGQAIDLMRARQMASSFLPWLFSPAICSVFLGGAVLLLARGRLGYGLVLEPLRSRTGSLLGLGLVSMLVAMVAVGAGRMAPGWGSLMAGAFLMLAWTPFMTLATVSIWAEENTLWQGMRWGGGSLWRNKWGWCGIGASYALVACATAGAIVGLGLGMTQLGAGRGAMALVGAILIALMGWGATLFYGLGAVLALSFHHQDLAVDKQSSGGGAQA